MKQRAKLIEACAQTFIRLAPEYLPFGGRRLLRAVADEHPEATLGEAKVALRLALSRADEAVQASAPKPLN